MMGGYGHNDPWAEKLQGIALPEADDAWKAMSVMLDKEMPRMTGRDRRRWILLIILLLLLIGICNCPGRWHAHEREDRAERKKEGAQGMVGNTIKESDPGEERIKSERTDVNATGVENGAGDEKESGSRIGGEKENGNRREREKVSGSRSESEKIIRNSAGREKANENGTHAKRVKKQKSDGKKNGSRKWAARQDNITGASDGKADPVDKGNSRYKGNPGDQDDLYNKMVKEDRVGGADTSRKQPEGLQPLGRSPGKNDSAGNLHKPVKRDKKDSLAAEKPGDKKKSSLHPERGWVVGIGVNQFFTLGQQQQSDYNSSGTTGHWGDYLPVPMVRYYFNRKLYLQLEAQFNTPQYTRKNLLVSQTSKVIDTTSGINETKQSSVSIQKLFYFNLPLSLHYSPFPNFYVGTGLQFARLTNGVGQFGVNLSRPGSPDTVTQNIKSLKEDSIYQQIKTTEFRWLFDMSYMYKHFVLGLRYNQALRNFINVQLSTTGQIVQARNSSLQLYLRYILWDSRKKKAPPIP